MGRSDGIHFGTGEEPDDGILELLREDAPTVMNEPEAKEHYARLARRSGLTVWRVSPDRRPAQDSWDAHVFSRSVFRSIDEHHDRTGAYPTDILMLNELNLDYERGDSKNDGGAYDTNPDNWPSLYRGLSRFLEALLVACKERAADRGFTARWWFPGWAPGHGEQIPEIAALWVPVAKKYDAVCLHAYYDTESITSDVLWYRRTFPGTPLLLGEYNMQGLGGDWRSASQSERKSILMQRVDELARTRARLERMCAQIPELQACYFIHHWEQDDSHEHDIRGVDARKALWDGRRALPPDDWTLSGEPEQPPAEEPDGPPAPRPQDFPLPVDDQGNEWQAGTQLVIDAIREVAPQEGVPELLLAALGIAESGRGFQSQERWSIWTDHGKEAVRQRNLGYAAQIMGWGRDSGTNDFSAGPFHQAWAWWDRFPGDPNDPNDPHRWNALEWLAFRKLMIQDHGYATRYAARRLKPYYDQAPSEWQWVLERYNRPNGVVSAGVRENYANALKLAPDVMGIVVPTVPDDDPTLPQGLPTRFESYTDPQPAGTFTSMPRGVILHGSRSGRASNPIDAEYRGTANYEVNNSYGYGWHATIGEGVVAVHLDARHWGWSAFQASRVYLAVEFAQPVKEVGITDGQVQAFVDWYRTYALPIWPNLPLHFPTHAEVEHSGETGEVSGKDDVFPYGDARVDELRSRIMARLGRQPQEPPTQPQEPYPRPETDAEKVARMVSAIGYMGGDVADRLERMRAAVDDGVSRPDDISTFQEAKAALRQFWTNWDAAYVEIGLIGKELRRVRDEQLD